MVVHLRFVQSQDFAAIEQLENDSDRVLVEHVQAEVWSPAPTGESRASEPGFIIVAELDSAVVAGFVHVLEYEGICHLEQVSVAPAYMRRGVGRALVVAAMSESRSRGYREISLRTFADVAWNAPFYRTLGFVEKSPATTFHLSLVEVEADLKLNEYGRRVHMAASLEAPITGQC